MIGNQQNSFIRLFNGVSKELAAFSALRANFFDHSFLVKILKIFGQSFYAITKQNSKFLKFGKISQKFTRRKHESSSR